MKKRGKTTAVEETKMEDDSDDQEDLEV